VDAGYDCDTDAVAATLREHLKKNSVHAAEAFLFTCDSPGVKPCNMLMNHYAGAGDAMKASALLDFMLSRGILPTAVTYATMCKVMAFHGQVKLVDNMVKMLERNQEEVNVYFYSALLAACGNCNPPDVTTAEHAFQEVVRKGFQPHRLLKVLARAVGVSRARELMSWAQSVLPGYGAVDEPLSKVLMVWGTPQDGAKALQTPMHFWPTASCVNCTLYEKYASI